MIAICNMCGSPRPAAEYSRPARPDVAPLPTFSVLSNKCACMMSKKEIHGLLKHLDTAYHDWLEDTGITDDMVLKSKPGSMARKVRSKYKQAVGRLESRLTGNVL